MQLKDGGFCASGFRLIIERFSIHHSVFVYSLRLELVPGVLKITNVALFRKAKKGLIVKRILSFLGNLARIAPLASFTLLVASCGGGSTASSSGSGAESSIKFASHIGTETWTYCAEEGGMCAFPGTREVRYGVEGAYTYKAATSSVVCSNDYFGDPAEGADKNCAYSNSEVPVASETWTGCAVEGEICYFTGTRQVEYGANGIRFWRTATDSIPCTNEAFGGDPVPGVDKACGYASSQADDPPPPSPPPSEEPVPSPTWTGCAVQGEVCTFTGTRQVEYGANGQRSWRTATGSIPCTNEYFVDPIPGVQKTCGYSEPLPIGGDGNGGGNGSTNPLPSGEILSLPSDIANGTTVNLECGRTYRGPLNIDGRSDIIITTPDGCTTPAIITPAQSVTGWTLEPGSTSIYSAPISLPSGRVLGQVSVSGTPVPQAHWPNRRSTTNWAGPSDTLPPWQFGEDINGARLISLIDRSTIGQDPQIITNGSVGQSKDYYLEGKRTWIDSPGEWAVSNGRLYMWSPDGQSLEGRVWATTQPIKLPDEHFEKDYNGINADGSSNITIRRVIVFAGFDGISANSSSNMTVLNSEIRNSGRDGIFGSGSTGLKVQFTNVLNSVRNGIRGWNNAVIEDSTVENTGTVGMPKATYGGITLSEGTGNTIQRVRVINSGYHGINLVLNRNTSVTSTTVDKACLVLTDCGGIYTGGFDGTNVLLGMNLTIGSVAGNPNIITNITGANDPAFGHAGRTDVAIYLDDSANGLLVENNTISGSGHGVFLHNAFKTTITRNRFSSIPDTVAHVRFQAANPDRIGENEIKDNDFTSSHFMPTYNLEGGGVGTNLQIYGTYSNNKYTSACPSYFARIWQGGSSNGESISYEDWKARISPEPGSSMSDTGGGCQ